MQLPAILASDLHLTANPDDGYRWALFPWLIEQARLESARSFILLGDLTDAKDYHPAELTNSIVAAIASLAHFAKVYILMGNHDYLKGGHAYFQFLNLLPNVTYVTKPFEDLVDGEACFWLPHSKDPLKDWAAFKDFSHYRYLFLHQTVSGAIASNGQKMDGEKMPALNAGKVYSGDIHVPQIIGEVEYVGSPYHVHFGDAFKPRCIALDKKGKAFDLHYETISRVTIDCGSLRELKRQTLRKGDQVKVRMHLTEENKHDWLRIRREAQSWLQEIGAESAGIELKTIKSEATLASSGRASIDPADAITRFVDRNEWGGAMLDIGLEILES